jgi:signal transduction histidine kinase
LHQEDNSTSAGRCQIYFSVKDSGIGIAESAKHTIFQPFHQADTSVVRRYGGSGNFLFFVSIEIIFF